MTTFRVRFEGPSLQALQMARELADAKGVDLTASAPPTPLGQGRSRLDLTLEGDQDRVLDAIERLQADLDADATLDVIED